MTTRILGGALGHLTDVTLTAPADNQYLRYDTATHQWVNETVTPPTVALDNLTDVTLTNPADNQFLRYDTGTGQWINETVTLTATLDSLTDVTITSPAAGQTLRYDTATGQWVNTGALIIDEANTKIAFGDTFYFTNAAVPAGRFHLQQANGAALTTERNADSTSGITFLSRRSRGTNAAPTKMIQGDGAGSMLFQAYAAATQTWLNIASINTFVEHASGFDDTTRDTYVNVITASGTGTYSEKLRITAAGALCIRDGITAPAANITSMAQLFIDTADGDLKIRFADGVVKTIVVDT